MRKILLLVAAALLAFPTIAFADTPPAGVPNAGDHLGLVGVTKTKDNSTVYLLVDDDNGVRFSGKERLATIVLMLKEPILTPHGNVIGFSGQIGVQCGKNKFTTYDRYTLINTQGREFSAVKNSSTPVTQTIVPKSPSEAYYNYFCGLKEPVAPVTRI